MDIQIGRVFVSAGARAALSMPELAALLARHSARERVIATGTQLVSEFASGVERGRVLKIWVITEPNEMRTLLMLPRETPYRQDDIEFDRTDGVRLEEVRELSQEGFRDPQPPRRVAPPTATRPIHRPRSPRAPRRPRVDAADALPPAAPATGPREQSSRAPRRDDPERKARDEAYRAATANLVLDYFALLAGPDCGALVDGFIDWLKQSPDAHRRYVDGDDMDRAALVERYLRMRALPRT